MYKENEKLIVKTCCLFLKCRCFFVKIGLQFCNESQCWFYFEDFKNCAPLFHFSSYFSITANLLQSRSLQTYFADHQILFKILYIIQLKARQSLLLGSKNSMGLPSFLTLSWGGGYFMYVGWGWCKITLNRKIKGTN